MKAADLVNNASKEEIVAAIADLADCPKDSAIDELTEFLRIKESHTMLKQVVPRLACTALLSKGPKGVNALQEVFLQAAGWVIYPVSILEALWYASQGYNHKSIMLGSDPLPESLSRPLCDETIRASQYAIRRIVLNAATEERYFDLLMHFIGQGRLESSAISEDENKRFKSHVFQILSESRIRISADLLTEFSEMIEASLPEESYQRFLTKNPVFLDPLASSVISKQKLGLEHITDFVIRSLNDKYLLVEIEKPNDSIFTQSDNMSAVFTHAFGQVLDFQQWIDSNVAYAQKLMPLVSSPRGLLVIGRQLGFTNKRREKLHRFNVNSASISVMTFDDILHQAQRLYQNIYNPVT